jgi:NhaA family Na+:H+ antiporter
LRRIQLAERDFVPPVVTVQAALHPWVAYGILPLFAFANAGVAFGAADLAAEALQPLVYAVAAGLLLGKPIGILAASAVAIRLRWCELPRDVGWPGLTLIALLGGIGFTMSIFIANLAFDSVAALESAKLGILVASVGAALLGLAFGRLAFRARVMDPATVRQAVRGGD